MPFTFFEYRKWQEGQYLSGVTARAKEKSKEKHFFECTSRLPIHIHIKDINKIHEYNSG